MSDKLAIIDVHVDRNDSRITELERENRQLRRERDDAQLEAKRAREDATRALGALRRQLTPLYKALQAVFGDLDAAGIADVPAPSEQRQIYDDARANAMWAGWKQRLGQNCAKVIDALLLGGEMTVTAIAVAAKMSKNTVYQATSKMGQAGILIRNGSKFSLKQL